MIIHDIQDGSKEPVLGFCLEPFFGWTDATPYLSGNISWVPQIQSGNPFRELFLGATDPQIRIIEIFAIFRRFGNHRNRVN